jgi:acetyl-CoA carboxylase carboxyl transferase subunit alpha
MLEYSIYSVISPEGCAAILWKDQAKVKEAADALKLTARHLHSLGVIDRVIEEPPGGAHRDADAMAAELGRVVYEELDYLEHFDSATLRAKRLEKYLAVGDYNEESP